MTDPIADMLTRMRNALINGRPTVDVPSSSVKFSIAEVLQREGYIDGMEIIEDPDGAAKSEEEKKKKKFVQNQLRITLKYGPRGERVITRLRRVSKPGCRVYSPGKELKRSMRGLGIFIVSTSHGVKSDREARKMGVGGEVLAEIF
jgi:small subunit ribosomal protein S8